MIQPLGAWPITGHLHLLYRSSELPHLVFGKLADKYGPIFTIKFGVEKQVVVSSSEMAKECIKTHDKVFCSRVKSLGPEILGDNYACFAFSSYGRYFRKIKNMVMHELFSNQRIEMLKPIREYQVNTAIGEIYEWWTKNKKSSGFTIMIYQTYFMLASCQCNGA